MDSKLSPENEQFVANQVAVGAFPSRDAAIDEAITLLKKQQELSQRIAASKHQIENGNYNEYDEKALKSRFDQLRNRVRSNGK